MHLTAAVLFVLRRSEPLNYAAILTRVIELRACTNTELDYCLAGLIRVGRITRAGGVYVLKLAKQEG